MSRSKLHLTINEGPKKGETLDRKPGAAIRIGRVVRGNTIAIRDPSISQKHLSLEFDPLTSRWAVTDLDTSNGTAVNGVRIPSSAAFPLSDGDSVKIGEDTLISIKIIDLRVSVTENESGRGRRRRNSVRVLKKDEISDSVAPTNLRRGRSEKCSRDSETGKALGTSLERGRRESVRGLKKDENSDSVARMKLRRGRSRNCLRDSKVDEALSAALDQGRRIRGVSDSVSKIDQVSDTVVDSVIKEDKARALKNLPRGRRGNSSRVSRTSVVDTSEVPTSLGRGRRGTLAELPRKNEASVPDVEGNVDVPKNLGRGRKSTRPQILKNDGNSSRVSKTDGNADAIVDTVVADSHAAPVSLRKRRRGVLANVSKKTEALGSAEDDNIDLPKMLTRRSTRSQMLMNEEVLDALVDDKIKVPQKLRRGRSGSTTGVKKEGLLDSVLEDCNQVPKNLGRRRKDGSSKDGVVSSSVMEDGSKVSKDQTRQRTFGSSDASKKNEALDSIAENRTVETMSFSRGKIRSSSTRFAKKDGTMGSQEESIQVAEVGKGRPIRGMARRTRAAYTTLSKKECLELDDPISIEVSSGNSNQIGKPEQTHHTSPRESRRGQNIDAFDKENNVCVISQLNEATVRSILVPDVGDFKSGNVANSAERSKVLTKIWNGNGIPNTTTKYKEDSKVSWHGTPFEERVEKALSGDKVFLHSS